MLLFPVKPLMAMERWYYGLNLKTNLSKTLVVFVFGYHRVPSVAGRISATICATPAQLLVPALPLTLCLRTHTPPRASPVVSRCDVPCTIYAHNTLRLIIAIYRKQRARR